MTTSDKLREIVQETIKNAWETGNSDSHECNTRFDDRQNLKNCISNLLDDAVSDLTALISEHYVEKAKYDELLRQRDELREALADMVSQFAYEGTKNGEGVMRTGGLSALESAFDALGLSDPITVEDFEAAIKNAEG